MRAALVTQDDFRIRGLEVGAGSQQEVKREAGSGHSAKDPDHSADTMGCVSEEYSGENVRNNVASGGKPSGDHREKAKCWPEFLGLCRG